MLNKQNEKEFNHKNAFESLCCSFTHKWGKAALVQITDATVYIICDFLYSKFCVPVVTSPISYKAYKDYCFNPQAYWETKPALCHPLVQTEPDLICVQTGICRWEHVPPKNSSREISNPIINLPLLSWPCSLPCWKLHPITVFVRLKSWGES